MIMPLRRGSEMEWRLRYRSQAFHAALIAFSIEFIILIGLWALVLSAFLASEMAPGCDVAPSPMLVGPLAALSLVVGLLLGTVAPVLPRYMPGAFSLGVVGAELHIADWRRKITIPLNQVAGFAVNDEDRLVDVRPWAGGVMAPAQPRLFIHMTDAVRPATIFFPLGNMGATPTDILKSLNEVLAAQRV